MARKKTTVYLDEDLITATKVLAATSGRREYEVMEEALRQYVAADESRRQLRSLLDRVARRSKLKDEEAMDLAYSELGAARKENSRRRKA